MNNRWNLILSLALFSSNSVYAFEKTNPVTAPEGSLRTIFEGAQEAPGLPKQDKRGLIELEILKTEHRQDVLQENPRETVQYDLVKVRYHIADRDKYVSHESQRGFWNGAWKGALAGLSGLVLGFLILGAAGALSGGAILGLAALPLAAGLAWALAAKSHYKESAKKRPKVFTIHEVRNPR